MAEIIDLQLRFARQQLGEKRLSTALRVARVACRILWIDPQERRYCQYIVDTPCPDHAHAMLYWSLRYRFDAFELFDAFNLQNASKLVHAVNAHVRQVIPARVCWPYQ